MKKIVLLLLLSLGIIHAYAQNGCDQFERLMQKAKAEWAAGRYESALNQLGAAREHCPEKGALVDSQLLKFTKEIAKQYQEATSQTEKAKQNALNAYANDLAYKSKIALRDGKIDEAFCLAEFARHYVERDNHKVFQALMDAVYDHYVDNKPPLIRKLILEGHTQAIDHLRISPDDKVIATAAGDLTIKLWDSQSGKHINTLSGHTGAIRDLQFSPDSKLLVTVACDNTIRLWKAESDTSIKIIQSQAFCPDFVRFSPNGKFISATDGTRSASLWEVTSGRKINSFMGSKKGIFHASFSPNSKLFATSGAESLVRIWNLDSSRNQQVLTGRFKAVRCFFFSPDGLSIATSSEDDTVRVWDVNSGQCLQSFGSCTLEHSYNSPFSPRGEYLATHSLSNDIVIWELSSRKKVITLKGAGGHCNWFQFSTDGNRVTCLTNDNSIRVWDIHTHKAILTTPLPFSLPPFASSNLRKGVQIAANGKFFAMPSSNNVAIVCPIPLETDPHIVRGASVSGFSKNNTIATITSNDTISVWDCKTGQNIQKLSNIHGTIIGAQLSSDGDFLVVSSGLRYATCWNITSGKQLEIFSGSPINIHDIQISPDCRHVATTTGESFGAGEVLDENERRIALLDSFKSLDVTRVWKVKVPSEFFILQGQPVPPGSNPFSPDGALAVTSPNDSTLVIWNIRTGQESHTLQVQAKFLENILFSPRNNFIATTFKDKVTQVWDISSGINTQARRRFLFRGVPITFSPDEKFLLAKTDLGVTGIWEIARGTQKQTLFDNLDNSPKPSFFFDYSSIIASTGKRSTKIWDVGSGEVTITIPEAMSACSISPDGTLVATSGNGTTKIRAITYDGLIDSWNDRGIRPYLRYSELRDYGLEKLLEILPDNEFNLIATRDLWQIKAFGDLYAFQAISSNILNKVEPHFERADRLYTAALSLKDEDLIRSDQAWLLRRWADVCQTNELSAKADSLRLRASTLWAKNIDWSWNRPESYLPE